MESKKRKTISFQCRLQSNAILMVNRKYIRKCSRSKDRNSLYKTYKPFNSYSLFCKEQREKYRLKNKDITLEELSFKWERLSELQIDHYVQLYQKELDKFYRLRSELNEFNNKEDNYNNESQSKKRSSLPLSNQKKVKSNKMIYYYNPELNEQIIKSCQKIRAHTEMKTKTKTKITENRRYTQIIQLTPEKTKMKRIKKKRKCFCGNCSYCIDDY